MNHQALIEEVGRLWWSYATAGNLEQAWQQSDRLLRAGVDFSHLPRFFRPVWDGRPVFRANVWLRCWRGLGDAIHFVRYAKPLRAHCARLVMEAPDELHRLFTDLTEIDELTGIDEHRRIGAEFVEIESTELPYVLRTTLATIPNSVPYLRAEPDRRVAKDGTLNVGVCWEGGNYDSRRRLTLADLAPLQGASGVRFWQLQRGPARAQIAGSGFRFENLSDQSMDVAMTADLVVALDLVITIDSMVAHLAGALFPLWCHHGHWLEGIGWLEAIRALEPAISLQYRGIVTHAFAWLQILVLLAVSFSASGAAAPVRERLSFNADWRFIKGDPGMVGLVADAIAGSSSLYEARGGEPTNSINFVNCHDGFTLNDLVSYNEKPNEANGEGNCDGVNDAAFGASPKAPAGRTFFLYGTPERRNTN